MLQPNAQQCFSDTACGPAMQGVTKFISLTLHNG